MLHGSLAWWLQTESVNPNNLAAALGGARFGDRSDNSQTALRRGQLPPSKGVISDPPAEAIVVLLDVSTSMVQEAYPQDDTPVPAGRQVCSRSGWRRAAQLTSVACGAAHPLQQHANVLGVGR